VLRINCKGFVLAGEDELKMDGIKGRSHHSALASHWFLFVVCSCGCVSAGDVSPFPLPAPSLLLCLPCYACPPSLLPTPPLFRTPYPTPSICIFFRSRSRCHASDSLTSSSYTYPYLVGPPTSSHIHIQMLFRVTAPFHSDPDPDPRVPSPAHIASLILHAPWYVL
jgi:hypothetical protein